jgi:hypothetical protein
MSPYDCVLAAVLLTAPPAPTAPEGLAALVEVLRPALVQAALDAEVLDPREEERIRGDGVDPLVELRTLQDCYQGLQRAPLLAECRLFPPRCHIDELLACNRGYKQELEARLVLDQVHAEQLRRAIAETEHLYFLWNLLRDAQYECYYVTVRRRSLMQLRDLIGMEAYCRFQMPPHVPVWHFPVWR